MALVYFRRAYVINDVIQLGFVRTGQRRIFSFAQRGKGAYLNVLSLTIQEPEKGQAIIGSGASNRRPLLWRIFESSLRCWITNNDRTSSRFGRWRFIARAHVLQELVHGYFESHLQ